MSGHLCLKWNNHSKAFLRSISSIQIKERYCDATIVCQGKHFPVHRMILSTCSDYFDDMFEQIKCQHPYVVFRDIEPEEMELLLNYMYQGEVNVVQERLPTLINAAEALKIKGLAVPDDLPTGKDSSRKRSINSEDNSQSKRRQDEHKRRRNSTTVGDSRDASQFEQQSSRVSVDGAARLSSSSIDEEPRIIKQEPIDVDAYDDPPLQSVFGQATASIDESSQSFPLPENKTYTSFPTEEGNSVYIKSEDDNGSNVPLKEPEYEEQDSSWSDYSSGSALPNLPPFEMGNQEDIPEDVGHSESSTFQPLPKRHLPFVDTASNSQNSSCSATLYGTYICPFCGYKSLSGIANLKRHIRLHHTGNRPFSCPVCFKKFFQKKDVKNHMRLHSGEKPYQCPKCMAKFNVKSSLNRHLRRKNECYGNPVNNI